jgi:D-amino-acid dehydrogenase
MSETKRHVIIVGGGVIGTACAHYLVRTGFRVTVLDADRMGQACSHGNCGLVCPSHVLPLAEPGAIRSALKAMLSPDAPFSIRPRVDLRLWSWLWHFAWRCNHRDMLDAGQAIQAILESSLVEYQRLVEGERIECEWQRRGLLFVYRSPTALESYATTNDLLSETFHAPARKLAVEELLALEPSLKTDVAGGWYYDHDAHLRPDKLLRSWRDHLQASGVEFREQVQVHGFDHADGKASVARTSQGTFVADEFIVATGATTPFLEQELGCRIPIQPGKGYSLTMPRPADCPQIPMIFPEHRVAVTPMASGYRLGSIMEFAGYDSSIQPERLALLKTAAACYLREPWCDPVEEVWYGWRPMTWDSLPIIDRSPRAANVWVAAGHNMLGLSMAPATGKLVAELVAGIPPHIDPRPYRISRF